MGYRQSILPLGGFILGLAALYGLWYQFGPESAKPDYLTMKKYVLTQLSDEMLKKMAATARKKRAKAMSADREMQAKFWSDYGERVEAWKVASAQCATDEAFKLRNADLCSGPPGPGLAGIAMIEPGGRVESEEQYIEWEIMFRCSLLATTIREARRNGCLPPK